MTHGYSNFTAIIFVSLELPGRMASIRAKFKTVSA